MGLSVSIITTSPWSDRIGEEQPTMRLPLLKEESSSSDRLRFKNIVVRSGAACWWIEMKGCTGWVLSRKVGEQAK